MNFIGALFPLLILPMILAIAAGSIYLFVLLCRALRKYIGSQQVRSEKAVTKRALGSC